MNPLNENVIQKPHSAQLEGAAELSGSRMPAYSKLTPYISMGRAAIFLPTQLVARLLYKFRDYSEPTTGRLLDFNIAKS